MFINNYLLYPLLFSVILVSGGFNSDAWKSVEVLYTNGTSYCTLPDIPGDRYGHTQDGLTACGGDDAGMEDNCVTLSNGQWTQSHTLLYDRRDHTSWALGDGRVVLMGGFYSGSETTTEIISSDSATTTEGFTLKYETRYN